MNEEYFTADNVLLAYHKGLNEGYRLLSDKIKEKIKELEQEIEEKQENGTDCTIIYEHEIDTNGIINVLKELLEED